MIHCVHTIALGPLRIAFTLSGVVMVTWRGRVVASVPTC